MARWPVLVGCSIAFASLGCASSSAVTAGLANAPNLAGNGPVDDRPYDVVSNGRDSCESVSGRSALRGHLPACPTTTHPVAVSLSIGVKRQESLVLPWLEHFYAGWPCTGSPVALGSKAAPWVASPAPATATCSLLELSPPP